MPYSVSIPSTFWTAIRFRPQKSSKVLAGSDALDLSTASDFVAVLDHGPDVDDPLALAAGDLRPVVGVRRVRQVLVLLVLLLDGFQQVFEANTASLIGNDPFDGELLRAIDDVFDHRTGSKVLEVEQFLVAVL